MTKQSATVCQPSLQLREGTAKAEKKVAVAACWVLAGCEQIAHISSTTASNLSPAAFLDRNFNLYILTSFPSVFIMYGTQIIEVV